MSGYETRERRAVNRARERQMARQRRSPGPSGLRSAAWRGRLGGIRLPSGAWQGQVGLFLRDLVWYITHTRQILIGIAGLLVAIFLLFIATHVLTGRIFPNVWAAGVPIGDLTVDQAALNIKDAWDKQFQIQLVDGDRIWQASPAELGLHLEAEKTVEAARAVGMAGIPFGFSVTPVVTLDFTTAQNFLLDLTTSTDIAPLNASYAWQGDTLVGVAGKNGRTLDIPTVMDKLMNDPVQVARTGKIELAMTVLKPDVADPEPLLTDAQAVTSQPFTINGYDPFTDQTISWSTTRDVLASWLEASPAGLALRDDTFSVFLDAQNASLNPSPDSQLRFLDAREIKAQIQDALQNRVPAATVRVRYRPMTYEVQRGDTGFRISRKTGIPFYLIQEANPTINWDSDLLSVGQIIQLPSRDLTLPEQPIPTKRIVVNLNNQSLVAFENDQPVFNWAISSGIDTAPTSPGVYQILTHNDIAAGSSFTLCNGNLECGQWEMYWFMGIYEVTPGLMNGFHGAVLLPGGRYLGGGNVGQPFTFGCVMSQDDNAQLLYQWADTGTVVEIISSEFAPQSDLGQLVWSQSQTGA